MKMLYVKPQIILEEEVAFETCCSCPMYRHRRGNGPQGLNPFGN